jgi:uncharacterized protein DUF2017
MAGPFARRRGGTLDVTLTSPEHELVASVVEQMTQVLEAPEQVAHTERLFPPAYLDDADAQADYARLMTADLLAGKRQAVASVQATLERGVTKRDSWRVSLNADEAQDWLAVLNDARLTLGTRLDVTEETYDRPVDAADPHAAAHEVFRYLGYLEEYLVDALMG